MARKPAGMAGIGAVVAAALALAPPAGASVDVVASGLHSPRGLDVVGNSLYVAEAGRGGGECADVEGSRLCIGRTGAISRVDVTTGGVERLVRLPSLRPEAAGDPIGPSDIALDADQGHVTVGSRGDVRKLREAFGATANRLGTLLCVSAAGRSSTVADVAGLEAALDPDSVQPTSPGIHSDPTSAVRDGSAVADGGGNTLIGVKPTGAQQLLTMFPTLQGEAGGPVAANPSSVTIGPDGAYYVGVRSSHPFPAEVASVYRLPREGGVPVEFAGGFHSIVDIGFSTDGSLLVVDAGPAVDATASGRLVRVFADGRREIVLSQALPRPGGLAVAPDGSLFVSLRGDGGGDGSIVRVSGGERVIAEFEHRGRHVVIAEDAEGPIMRLPECQLPRDAFRKTESGYYSPLLPFERFDDPVQLAKRLVDGDGVLFVLCA